MAWRCSGSTNSELIDNLVAASILHTPRLVSAFKKVDRARFVPPSQRQSSAYQDAPVYIGYGATISAPHMHASALEALEGQLKEGARVMDIGCGSGYLLEVMSHLVGPTGTVLGIDHLPQLTSLALSNLSTCPPALRPHPGTITVLTADGRLGSPPSHTPEAGWDVIHVGAASPTMPTQLIQQLARGGRLFVPVGPDGGNQAVWQIDKGLDGEIRKERLFGVRYVPLTDAEEQHSKD